MSHTYRNFILGGQVRGTPVLVTAQGTYGPMALQAWNVDMRQRWEVKIPGGPGPRGSHMSPVVDFDNDGVEEVLWGERRIELDAGKQIACGDCNRYNGHSDVIQPFLDWTRNRWFTFTCRENDPVTSPRVAVFDPEGARIWGDVDRGHMDVGWVAHLDPQSGPVAMSLRIGTKSLGPGGLARTGVEEFVWEAISGKPRKLGFSVEGTYPVDINGDGFHELIRQGTGRESEIIDAAGNRLANFSGTAVCTSKLLKLPGEQIAAFTADGIVRIWTDRNAVDSARALKRYAHPYYRANARLSAAGYNVKNLGGL
jgi:hypothetical protein